jgi:NAD(P)-dependent dehydrogenase (short-subunit alcohol dehydrogenase family)
VVTGGAQGIGVALCRRFHADSTLEAATVAERVIAGMREERFLIVPHPKSLAYFQRKAADYDRWIRGMRRAHAKFVASGRE